MPVTQSKISQITNLLNVIYILVVLLFFLDDLTSVDIKNQLLKSFVYFGILIGTPFILFWNTIKIIKKEQKIIWIILPTTILITILIIEPMKILYSVGVWNTQTILYENKHFAFNTIEFQMKDIGALGYEKRKVQVFYLTPLFIITNGIPNDIDKKIEWAKINKDINELKLKSP